jgi:transcriptional regulator of acetoin/glycerol metabolism
MNPSDLEHALRNDLAIILGYAELLLQDAAADDPHRKDVEEIARAARSALSLIGTNDANAVTGATPAVHDAPPALVPGPTLSAAEDLDQLERAHIVRVLAHAKGNKQAAARRLGISRRTLYRRLQRHGLLEAPAD